MEERFSEIDIKNEKINRIINCGYEVFSKNDFEKASTNNIVKQAGISRGLLYHYFKDKQDLFDYLAYFSLKETLKIMEEKIDWNGTDLLDRIYQNMIARFEMMEKYPYMYDFLVKYQDRVQESIVLAQADGVGKGFRERFYKHNIDLSKIKDGVDKEKMINVCRWTVRGIVREYFEQVNSGREKYNKEKASEICESYIEFLKNQFYK